MSSLAGLIVLAATVGPADSALASVEREQKQAGGLQELLGDARRLGPWRRNQQVISDALESIWRHSGWTSESDQFARKLMERVSEHPPWQLNDRFETFCGALAERYGLESSQRQELYGIVTRDAWTMFFRHSSVLLRVGREVLQARISQKPFTEEQVARWSKLMQPLMAEVEQTVAGWAGSLEGRVDPEKRELLRRDLAAHRGRIAHGSKMMGKWATGRWQPTEWGLEKDPIHMGVAGAVSTRPAKLPAIDQALPVTGRADAWERYVRDFIARHELDESQQVTARSILDELRSRAAVKNGDRSEAARAAREALFAELKKRLDAIPTQSQRARASRGGAEQK